MIFLITLTEKTVVHSTVFAVQRYTFSIKPPKIYALKIVLLILNRCIVYDIYIVYLSQAPLVL